MTNIPLGVFPLSENMLKDDRVAEYSQQMKEFYRDHADRCVKER